MILDRKGIDQHIRGIASQIASRHGSNQNIVLVGIRTGGAFLAERLRNAFTKAGLPTPPLGVLDITLYRDDWTRIGSAPVVRQTHLPFSLDGKLVILVDDVLYTGRTVRAAMDALMDYGRPSKIELAILADRGKDNRELPIAPDYTGGTWPTSSEETINVYLEEEGFEDHVAIEKKKAA